MKNNMYTLKLVANIGNERIGKGVDFTAEEMKSEKLQNELFAYFAIKGDKLSNFKAEDGYYFTGEENKVKLFESISFDSFNGKTEAEIGESKIEDVKIYYNSKLVASDIMQLCSIL